MRKKHQCFIKLIVLLPMLAISFAGCSAIKYVVKTQQAVSFSTDELAQVEKIVDGRPMIYRPSVANDSEFPETSDEKLLILYAPIIIQGQKLRKNEPELDDMISAPALKTNSKQKFSVVFDQNDPVIFSRVEHESVHGMPVKQLVYNFWYPRHPVGLAEKGDVDGGVLRITLDANQRPAVFEYVWPCGCFHNAFVSDWVEQSARDEFGKPLKDKTRFAENHVPDHFDWLIQDVVQGAEYGVRPIVLVSAQKHRCVTILSESNMPNLATTNVRPYRLEQYSALENLPVVDQPGQTASIFNDDGYVYGARRSAEEILFRKMNHPGWPRRLDMVQIHWDQEDWINPHLVETFLRLPKAVAKTSDRSNTTGDSNTKFEFAQYDQPAN